MFTYAAAVQPASPPSSTTATSLALRAPTPRAHPCRRRVRPGIIGGGRRSTCCAYLVPPSAGDSGWHHDPWLLVHQSSEIPLHRSRRRWWRWRSGCGHATSDSGGRSGHVACGGRRVHVGGAKRSVTSLHRRSGSTSGRSFHVASLFVVLSVPLPSTLERTSTFYKRCLDCSRPIERHDILHFQKWGLCSAMEIHMEL